ncbi:MAG: hypothetical protein C0401_04430 [Anaerolinea sp.]|nr:hypothetical protein [Anaerolinea sp.]
MCAPHNPNGKPFCCDICHAVPVAYKPEWDYLKINTKLWHIWQGDECLDDPCDPTELMEQTPEHLYLLTCKGPALCERDNRTTSCRQFPFFPYITSDHCFIGLACDWEFESKCWVLSHLDQVTDDYRKEFIQTYDELFSFWSEDFDNYAQLSEETREHYATIKQRIPILHRNGNTYLVSPKTERMRKIDFGCLKQHPPY